MNYTICKICRKNIKNWPSSVKKHVKACEKYNLYGEEMINYYSNNKSIKFLAQKYKTSSSSISAFLKKNNVKVKSENGQYKNFNNIDECYFDDINTNEKAWLLGLLAADGTIKDNGKGLQISQSGDRGLKLIKYIKKILKISNKICTQRTTHQNSYSIGANNQRIVDSLAKFNIIPRKTYSFKYPESLPQQFFRDFIRGYIDGDGCVMIRTNSKGCVTLNVSFVGTLEFIQRCSELIPIKTVKINVSGGSKKVYEIRWSGKKAIEFCKWLYSSNSLYRYYKYYKFNEYLDFFKKNPPKYVKYEMIKNKVLKLFKKGLNGMQIAKKLNIKFQTVYNWINQHESSKILT